MKRRAGILILLSAAVIIYYTWYKDILINNPTTHLSSKASSHLSSYNSHTLQPEKAEHGQYEWDVHDHPLHIDDVHNPLYIDEFNHWSFDNLQGYWIWYKNNSLVQREATYQIPINSPYSHQPFHNFRQNNSTKVIFYGSSHIRELYFSLIRLDRGGLRFDDTLEEVVMKVGSGPSTGIPNQSICDKYKTGYTDGLYGVNIEVCGFPGKRLVPELGPNVAIGFKTFLHTPDAEKEFIQFLELSSLTDPDVVVVDIGIWGVRGKRLGDSNATNFVMDNKMDELEYYLNWVCTAFSSSSFILFIYERDDSMLKPLMEVVEKKNNYFLWRKDRLLKSRPSAMPCAHGCRGPLMEVMARQFLEFLRLMLL